jgi:hypothetical protein
MRRLTVDGVAPAEAARIAKAAADPRGQAPAETAGQQPGGLTGQQSGGLTGQQPGGPAGQMPSAASPEPGRSSQPDAHPPATARGLRRAALALDPADVDRLLDLALARGVVPAWTTVIAPALRDLGRQYSVAGRYIAAEHLLSGAVSIALARVPRPATRPPIVAACGPGWESASLPDGVLLLTSLQQALSVIPAQKYSHEAARQV